MSRSTKPAMRRVVSGGADSIAPLIVLAVLALLGVQGFFQQKQGGSAALIWTDAGVRAAMFFAVTTPLVLLGIFGISQIFNFKLTSGSYMRAAAVAAVPVVAILGLSLLPPNPVLRTLLLMGSVPLAMLLARALFDLNPIETLAAGAICAPLFFIGLGATNKVSTMALVAGGGDPSLARGTVAPAPGTARSSTPAARPRGASPAAPVDPAQRRLESLATRIEAMGGDALNNMTREQFTERLASLQTELNSLKSASGTTSQWQVMSNQLRDLAAYGQNLPSEKPDESLFQPMVTSQNWSNVTLDAQGDEVSFDSFNLRLPGSAKLDLKSSDPALPALTWTWPNSWSTMSLKLVSAPDPRQRRPWVVTRAMMQRFSPMPRLFIIESAQTAMTAGNLVDTVFFRVDRTSTTNADILYAGLVDGKWLIATISGATGSEARNAFEAAIKTLRKRATSEPISDPLSPAVLVTRLGDDPETAGALLKKQGSAGEEALLAALGSGDARMTARILDVLAEVATAKSLGALRPLAEGTDPATAKAAITVLKRIAPEDYDDLAMAAMTLKRGSDVEKRAALQALAAATKDPKRPQITREIEVIVLLENPALQQDAIKALIVWADSQTAPRLIPWLDQGASAARRRAALAILPTTKDPIAVFPMLRWVTLDTEAVVKGVIAMGPVAEDEVIRRLFTDLENNRNPEVRKAGARILQEIGTTKSLPVLQRASNDPRDATAAQVAKVALDILRQRVQPGRGTARGGG